MEIKNASFVKSSSDIEQCPASNLPEFAFIGRSNVGKSSLINMLCNKKGLAKVSSKPGKTQLINHFLIDKRWHLVDLPGYGWAKVSKSEKQKWGAMIHDYLMDRKSLVNIFVLIDSRLKPQPVDVEFINWLGEKRMPFTIVFTKADKQSKNKTQSSIAKYKKELKTYWEELPPSITTSAITKDGKDQVLSYISDLVDEWHLLK